MLIVIFLLFNLHSKLKNVSLLSLQNIFHLLQFFLFLLSQKFAFLDKVYSILIWMLFPAILQNVFLILIVSIEIHSHFLFIIIWFIQKLLIILILIILIWNFLVRIITKLFFFLFILFLLLFLIIISLTIIFIIK